MTDENTIPPVTLGSLRPAAGSHRARRRLGRGPGSGLGKTSGRGHKGHKARTGGSTNPGFEGGQMPMYRRLPKRGFTNPFKVVRRAINLRDLDRLSGDEVNPVTLVAAGLLNRADDAAKLLGTGDVTRALVVRGIAVSASARARIEAAGGRIESE
jgi:large subunit ribosomal protein L15